MHAASDMMGPTLRLSDCAPNFEYLRWFSRAPLVALRYTQAVSQLVLRDSDEVPSAAPTLRAAVAEAARDGSESVTAELLC